MKRIQRQTDYVKLFALVAMTLDHVPKIFGYRCFLNDTVGRMAFPLFAFLIIQNFYQFHPIKKYLIRLGGFGILSSVLLYPFETVGYSVLFEFFWALLFIECCEQFCQRVKTFYWQFYWLAILFLMILPFILVSDYSILGFFFLMSLYAYMKNKTKVNYLAVLICATMLNFGGIIPVVSTLITTIALLSFIDIKGGKRLIKWWGFYLYYPLHQVLLYSLRVLF
jgi:hypothetical protein